MLNKVMLIGRLGFDPEIRYMPSGGAVANVRLATTRNWKDKQTGERREETEWHRVVFFGRQAEVVGEYLKKGRQIYVEGRLQTRKWQGQDGQDRYTTEIVAENMQMLGSRGGGTDSMSSGEPPSAQYGGNAAPSQPSSPSSAPAFDDFDDDIPF